MHELGHCFDLAHTPGGIMGRGFDDFNCVFSLWKTPPPATCQEPNTEIIEDVQGNAQFGLKKSASATSSMIITNCDFLQFISLQFRR